jgi:DNA-binding CsgD family transcriptional regulator/tetratricopeptide (TPR) repeat protein
VADESGYAFRHALLREVVHEDMLPGQHARLHARCAVELERHPELAEGSAAVEIAHHWSAAHDVAQAFRWSIRAAETKRAAHFETLKLYERALELWDQVPDAAEIAGPHVTVLDKAMAAARDAGETERALVLANAALAETASDDLLGRIHRLAGTGELRCNLMKPGSVEALTEAAALLPADAPPKFAALVAEQLARITLLAGHDATDVARAAVEAAEASGSSTIESNARNTLGVCLVNGGHEEEGLASLRRAGELGRDNARTMLRYYVNYSDALTNTGRYADAVAEALNGIEVAASLGLERSLGAMLVGNAAEPLLALGEWSRAEKMIERALELDPPAHQHAQLQLLLARLRLWQGELDQADALLTQYRGLLVGEVTAPQYAGLVAWTDAELAMATGDLERAWRNIHTALQQWDRHDVSGQYPMLRVGAAAAHALDQLDAGDRTERVRAALSSSGRTSIATSWLPVIEAELTDVADGWRSAWTILAGGPAPAYLRPYAGLRFAQHLVAQRERAEARSVLVEASAEAERLGAGLLSERIAVLSQRAGLSVSDRHAARPTLASLTPREMEVLELVVAGRSNGEIGAALFISTKTASVHVSNILAKLGVTSRGEAAALAHRIGLDGAPMTADVIPLRA